MSKGSKRHSAKYQARVFKQLFPDTRGVAQTAAPKIRPAYLDLTDEQIDRLYFTCGKADRIRMKKAAKQERERQAVRFQLQRETIKDP